jgi:hypothetical protein
MLLLKYGNDTLTQLSFVNIKKNKTKEINNKPSLLLLRLFVLSSYSVRTFFYLLIIYKYQLIQPVRLIDFCCILNLYICTIQIFIRKKKFKHNKDLCISFLFCAVYKLSMMFFVYFLSLFYLFLLFFCMISIPYIKIKRV